MSVLVVGASGATGKQLVEQLLNRGQKVKVIVRSVEKLPESWKSKSDLSAIEASVLEISEVEMAEHLKDCDAVASCLGHNMSWKGIYGQPKKLVHDAIVLVCNAIKRNAKKSPVKVVLMNTSGNQNRDLNEKASFGEKMVIVLLRLLLPPHVDNEMAADFLRTKIGQEDQLISWVTVRPDTLQDDVEVSAYEVFPSPIRSPIFNAGKTSRINVGHFMADLITNEALWNEWKGQMPVIYNKVSK